MRPYREIASFLLIRRQVALGWKIGFFIVCGVLLYVSLTLSHIRIRSHEILGTVVDRAPKGREEKIGNDVLVKLDSGETVRARALSNHKYLPGRLVIVKETTTNFFGIRKYEVKSYANEINRQ
jgi:hypothetical protein